MNSWRWRERGSGDSNRGDSRPPRRRKIDEDDGGWKFDSRLLEQPHPHDGIDLAYFQPSLEMPKSEAMSKREPCGNILKVPEEVGERRLDSQPVVIVDVGRKFVARSFVDQIENEIFRTLKGLTSGDAQAAIVQGMTRDVAHVSRRLLPKAKSRTKAAVREFRQETHLPRKAGTLEIMTSLMLSWAKISPSWLYIEDHIHYQLRMDLLEVYCSSIASEAVIFAQFRVEGSVGPNGFPEEMET